MLLALFIAALAQYQVNPSVLTPEVAYAAPIDNSTTTLMAFASSTAIAHGLDPQRFVAVIECESNFDPNAIGDNGTSIGIAQLHYPSRDWHIATSTAFDPRASIEIMAAAWARGETDKWSCYGLVQPKGGE